ncbi:hypothetical protein ACNQFZ_13820 [Schinkia sp. CFF1]
MKRKLLVGMISGAFILGAGSLVFAATNSDGEGIFNFKQMQPYIEQMHPNLTTEQQKEMFDACHGQGGMMENFNGNFNTNSMMNQF